MSVSRAINPPCEQCGTETLIGSDHSGGWEECPVCGHMQNIRYTLAGGPGKLTELSQWPDSEDRITRERRELAEAIELLKMTKKLLRRTYGAKDAFAYQAQLHVLGVEDFLDRVTR